MPDIVRIKSLVQSVGSLAPSGFGIAFHFGLTAPDFLFQTYAKDWVDIYSEKGFVMHDPVVRWGWTETGSIRWSEIEIPDDHKVLEQGAKYGLKYGIGLTVESGGTRSGGGLARNDREYTDAEIAELTGHIQELHDLTASKDGMTAELRQTLHRLSSEMTHPSAT
ncbi:MAG: autoinducer binding domain-containing protein [Octadecabacter sp.]